MQYPGEWKFATIAEIPRVPPAVVYYFHDVLTRVAASAANARSMIESFKTCFGNAGTSSSLDWAITDLRGSMDDDEMNAVVFLDGLWSALELARAEGLAVPTVDQVNAMLRRNEVPYELRPPNIVRATADAVLQTQAVPGAIAATRERYILGEPIGKGGFGQVYVATRETSAATFEYALKLLDPSPFVDRDRALLRFRREIAALQGLQHRGIVPFVDAGIDAEGRPYIVMPRIRGKNIRDWTEGRGAGECAALMMEVLNALRYAHANGVLHRDLKPSNIMVRETDAQPMLLDFGNAYLLEELDEASLTTTAVGSIGYIPPEVLANPKLRTPLQDVFASAVILYELIARRRPDPLAYEPLSPSYTAPPALDAALRQALGSAAQRQQSIQDLHADITRAFVSA